MISIYMTDRLTGKIPREFNGYQLMAMRKLAAGEINIARKRSLERFYLPTLNDQETADFYRAFDNFWDAVVENFPRDHFFWRNIVSSKIQEWERSLTYFLLILYTLNRRAGENINLIFIPGSVEEANVLRAWGQKYHWKIADGRAAVLGSVRRLCQGVENLLRYARYFLIHAARKKFAPAYADDPIVRSDNRRFLIVSLFYPFSFKDGNYHDPFFKDFHRHLAEKGYTCQYVSDCLNTPNREIKKSLENCRDVRITTPYALIRWRELLGIFARLWTRKLSFAKPVLFLDCDLTSLIRYNAWRFQFDFSVHAEVYYQAIRNISEKVSFEKLLVIFEGNVFERAVIQAFRRNSTSAINAYSHAVIFSLLSLKLYMSDKETTLRPEPDYYVCSGERERSLLINIGKRDASRIIAACALRNIPIEKKADQTSILVALDGMWSSVMLLDWLIKHQDILKDHEVRVRAHPNVPLRDILRQSLYPLPQNFVVSADPLGDDIKKAKCVIYRHTSVGMQAILNGIPAIHLRIDTPLDGDPIEALREGKWTASSPEEFKAALDRVAHLNERESHEMFDRAKTYARQYFSPPSEDRLNHFIEAGR